MVANKVFLRLPYSCNALNSQTCTKHVGQHAAPEILFCTCCTVDVPYSCSLCSAVLLLPPAALVKVLRRCVRDMASKSSAFVELCVKTEKEAAQEVRCKHAVCWAVAQQLRQGQRLDPLQPLLGCLLLCLPHQPV